jgi:hypothetical protein
MAQLDRFGQAGSVGRSSASLDEGLRSYMLGVYNYMGLGVAFTAVVTMLLMNNPALMRTVALGPMKWVLFVAILGLGWFAPKAFYGASTALAHGAFWLYSALWGALISPMIYMFFAKSMGGVVFQAFAVTAAMFFAMSLIGYTTKKDLTGWGNFLSMASIGLILVALASYFLISDPGVSKTFSLVISCVVVLLFAAVTAWETQQIKDMYVQHAGDAELVNRSSIFGAFLLYGSFITLFTHILNILGITSED